jgi:hypothetical protein
MSKTEAANSDEMHRLLTLVCYATVPIHLRAQLHSDYLEPHLIKYADELNRAELPWAGFLLQSWSALAAKVEGDENLATGLRLMGQAADFEELMPNPELNLFYATWLLYNAFDEDATSDNWVKNCLTTHLYDVMRANDLYEDSDSDEHVDPEVEFENYFDGVDAKILAVLKLESWRDQIVSFAETGPRNTEGQSCLDVIERVIPEWRSTTI